MEASRKEGRGIDEAVTYCTKKSALGWRAMMEMDPERIKPTFTWIEYGKETIEEKKATVSIRVQVEEGGGVDTIIFHLEKEEGKWGVVGFQEGTDLVRFDDQKIFDRIEYLKRAKKEK